MSGRRSTRREEPDELPALRVLGLTKHYGDVVALAELDLVVPEGEAVVLVGHNGSGKSTLLSMVGGVLEPTDGQVVVHGEANDTLRARALRSWIPDNPVLYDDLSLGEHIEYIARLLRILQQEVDAMKSGTTK